MATYRKFFFHHDKSTCHTAAYTKAYMDQMTSEHGIRFIQKEDIPIKGPDVSPMDFFGFGYLKQEVKKTRVRTLNGLWKKCQSIWDNISPETCAKVFQSWKKRCRLVAKRHGAHIEQVKEIHHHKRSNYN